MLKSQKEFWKIYNDDNTKPPVKVMSLSKIMDSTMKLTELYDALPIIGAIRNCDDEEEHPIVRAVREKDFSHICPSHISTTTYGSDDSNCGIRDSDYDGVGR
jgi:hypothetical protein